MEEGELIFVQGLPVWPVRQGLTWFKKFKRSYRLSLERLFLLKLFSKTQSFMEATITRHLSKDPVLAKLVKKIPFPQSSNTKGVYQDLLGSIISQQLSGKVATVIENRFLALFEDGVPHTEKVTALEIPVLRSVGLSNQKATYMRNVAEFFQREKLENHDWASMADEDIIRYLTQIKGVGKWTVEMILMFSLRRPDVLPVDDYGIQSAIVQLYGLTETKKALRDRMVEIAEPWRPYRTYACYYLWRYKDGGTA
jgi:DNA-3-methyladenine glycosylase II